MKGITLLKGGSSLAGKMQYISLLLVLVVAVAYYQLASQAEKRDHLAQLAATFSSTLSQVGGEITQHVEELSRDVRFLSQTPPIQGIARAVDNNGFDVLGNSSQDEWNYRLEDILLAFMTAHTNYFQIRFIGVADGGRELVRVERTPQGLRTIPREQLQRKGMYHYFRETMALSEGKVYIGSFNLNREHGEIQRPFVRTLRGAIPVFDDQGRRFGMLIINLDTGHLLDHVAEMAPHGAKAFVTNEQGQYLLAPDGDKAFGFEFQRDWRLSDDFPQLAALYDDQLEEVPSNLEVNGEAGEYYLYQQRMAFDINQPKRRLVVGYLLEQRQLSQAMSSIEQEAMLGGLAMLLLAGLLIHLLLHWLFSPLRTLSAWAGQIAHGEMERKLPRVGGGEIGALASTLDTLRSNVVHREDELLRVNRELDQRVQERSQELDVLYRLSSIMAQMADPEQPLELVFRALIESVLVLWSDGRDSCARVFYDGDCYQLSEFCGKEPGSSVPLMIGGEVRGVIEVHCPGRSSLDGEKRALLDLISHEVATAIEYRLSLQERQSMEPQLRQAQKLEAVGQLAAGIAHEINTPTQFVNDNAHFLQDAFADYARLLEAYRELVAGIDGEGRVADGQRERVAELAEELELDYLREEIPLAIGQSLDGLSRISRIVQAMKEFSHPGSEEKSPTNLNQAISATVEVSRNEWKYHAEVELDLAPGLPLVPVLPGEFNQVILNLVVNAAHAIPESGEGGMAGRIRIATRQDGEWAEIVVSDNGSGIPAEIRERIFDPFFTTKEVGKGTGQGLAIAWSVVVDKHGGSLEVESEEGHGSRFMIRLPLHAGATTDEVEIL